ncbi:MAG: fibronectin type III domain-containing protein [Clostridia bacterium]|nr:fibronectin type III domain-containing protein [Clostridia bacterium]
MISRFLSGNRSGIIAGLLIMAMCLPLCTGALAASPPSAPESLTAVPGNGQVALVWFAPEDDGGAAITGYQVSMDGGATWIDVGLATNYTFDDLTGGIMYVFMVRAVNDAGYGEEAIVNAKPKDAKPDVNVTGNQQGQGQVITGGGGGGIIVEPPPPPPPPEDPPEDPPPKKEPPEEPQPKDNIPIEIDPEEVTEKPFRPIKPQIMDLVGTYTIVASGTQSAGDTVPTPNTPFRFDLTLDFRATKVGGSMYGSYNGSGSLNAVMDQAFYAAGMPGFSGEWNHAGPLTNIAFALYAPPGSNALGPLPPIQPGSNTSGSLQPLPPIQSVGKSGSALTPLPPIQPANNSGSALTPLPPIQPADNSGSSLQPLPPIQPANNSGSSLTPLPPLKPMPPAQATGAGTMFWNGADVAYYFTAPDGSETGQPGKGIWTSESLEFEVTLYANGNGIVKFRAEFGLICYKARLVKSVTLVDVK